MNASLNVPAILWNEEFLQGRSVTGSSNHQKKANAKSVISILGLEATCGNRMIITAEGNDEELAVKEMVKLIDSGLGE